MSKIRSTREVAELLGMTPSGVRGRAKALGVELCRGKGGALGWTDDAVAKIDHREHLAKLLLIVESSKYYDELRRRVPLLLQRSNFPVIEAIDPHGKTVQWTLRSHDPVELQNALLCLEELQFIVMRVVKFSHTASESSDQAEEDGKPSIESD